MLATAKSDFDASFFTENQRKIWAPLLERLRVFEQNAARFFRRIDKDVRDLQEWMNYIRGKLRSSSMGRSMQPVINPEAGDQETVSFAKWLERFNDTMNQLTGDIRYVDEPESFRLMRLGEIDFPDHQEIMKLTKPSTVWLDNPSSRAEAFANRVVSTGLFSFLKGGMVSLAQLWTFLCCVYVSLIAISQFVLPPQIGQIIRLFNIAVPIVWAYEKASKRIRERRARGEQQRATADEPPVEALPLAERWPSDRALEPVRVAAIDKRNFRMSCFINSKPAVVLADTGASVSICDKDCARKFKMTNYLPPTIPGIIGIGQEILTPVGRAEIGLEIAGYRSNASVHVFDREIGEGNYDMILGFDEIKKLPFYFDFKRAQLVPMATLTDIPDRKISKWPIQTLVVEIDLSESNWSEEDLSSLKDLVNQNVDVFSNHEYDFGLCTIKAPPIRTTTQEPITGRPYRVPDKYRDELDSHIQKMLKADASQVSFAGGLFQMAKDSDKLHAVSYCSRTTTATEQRLPATHAELGAIVYALSVFKPTIYQCDLTIHTDHRPLTYLFHKASTNAKLNRWLLAIQDISPKIAYVEGKANRVADALSRVAIPWTKVQEKPIPEEVPYLLLADVILPITLESVKSETSKDQTLKSVMDNIRSEWEVPSEEHLESYHRIRNALTIRNGVIYKDATRIVIPKALQNPVLCILHRTHMGSGVAVETAVRLWLQDFRATPNTVTNESPASRFLGREIRTPLDALRWDPKTAETAKESPKTFHVGQAVWVRDHRVGTKNKWQIGVIVRPIGQRMYEVATEKDSTNAHIDQLRARAVGNDDNSADWINALKDALILLTNKIDDVVQQLSSQNEMLHRILQQTNYPQPSHVPYPSFQSHYQPTHNPVQFNTGIPPQFTQATRPFGTQPSQPSAMALKRRAQRERKKAKRLAEQQNNPKETTPANTTSILPTAPASIQPVAPPIKLSFGTANDDTLAVLLVADNSETFINTGCVYRTVDESIFVPAVVRKMDDVPLCQLMIYVVWCALPIAKNGKRRQKYEIDLGRGVLADPSLSFEPPLIEVTPRKASKKPRQMVLCMSRIFGFEKWQLLITALEVYRLLQVDLVVAHVNSVLAPIFELMKAYEKDGILAIRSGISFQYLKNMNYNPNAQVEYSGQLVLAHDCFYEFRESAEFIALLDWDDLLITNSFARLGDAFQAALLQFPEAAYFRVNKLESTFMEQDHNSEQFSLGRLIHNGILTKYVYNSEKMVVRPSKLHGFWVHHSRYRVGNTRPVQLTTNYSVLLHLARKQQNGTDKFSLKYLQTLEIMKVESNFKHFVRRAALRKIIPSLPNRTVYFDAISQCSRYINAYPDLADMGSPCLSYEMCTFPQVETECVIEESRFRSVTVEPYKIYSIHLRTHSGFRKSKHGCFANSEY
ncbi:glycosyltransferase family 92 domain-containing protein [Ditylenchus destructor]|uniref:Glycosyltransferase family 92 domain-containing protein n=1 Tax=Ditylenchus destructor TaxID=166010 RepID=A0AAD4R5U1_9BILA|nr:glycosyltransferase family 92 domain-containing protein [Ditylenchus destructor]